MEESVLKDEYEGGRGKWEICGNGEWWMEGLGKFGSFSAPTFGLGGLRLWEKEDAQRISGKNRKTR